MMHVVLDEQDGHAPLELGDVSRHLGRLLLAHPCGRLIEQEEDGVAGERQSELQAALLIWRRPVSRKRGPALAR